MTRARILADYVAGGTTAAEFDHLDGLTSAAVGINDTQTLTNKTLTTPDLGTPSAVTLTNATFPAGHLLKVQCFDALAGNVYSTSAVYTNNAVGACTFSPDGGGNNLSYIFAILISTIEVQSTIDEGRLNLETSASGDDITNMEYSVGDWGGMYGLSGRVYGASHISKAVRLDGTGHADIAWQFSVKNASSSGDSAFTHNGPNSRIIVYEYKG